MTEAAWQRYMADFMEQVRAAFPGKEIVHNAIWYSGDTPDVRRQLRAADVVGLERGFNDTGPHQRHRPLVVARVRRPDRPRPRRRPRGAARHQRRHAGRAPVRPRHLPARQQRQGPARQRRGEHAPTAGGPATTSSSATRWARATSRTACGAATSSAAPCSSTSRASPRAPSPPARACATSAASNTQLRSRSGRPREPCCSVMAWTLRPRRAPARRCSRRAAAVVRPSPYRPRPACGSQATRHARASSSCGSHARRVLVRVSGVVRGARSGRVLVSARTQAGGERARRAQAQKRGNSPKRLRVGAGRWRCAPSTAPPSRGPATATAARAVTVRR